MQDECPEVFVSPFFDDISMLGVPEKIGPLVPEFIASKHSVFYTQIHCLIWMKRVKIWTNFQALVYVRCNFI